jgi:hypothetical protein
MPKRLICGYQFLLITTVEAERDGRGPVLEFSPRFAGGRELSDAPFYRFTVPGDYGRGGGCEEPPLSDSSGYRDISRHCHYCLPLV